MILFVALSPGMFLSIPPVGSRWWMTGKMSLTAVFVHAAVFAVILWLMKRSSEGFAPNVTDSTISWMLPRIQSAKDINDSNVQAILRRIATERAMMSYDGAISSVFPGLIKTDQLKDLEEAVKVLKNVDMGKVEDARISTQKLGEKVIPELFKKFGNREVSDRLEKLGASLPDQKNIDKLLKIKPITGAKVPTVMPTKYVDMPPAGTGSAPGMMGYGPPMPGPGPVYIPPTGAGSAPGMMGYGPPMPGPVYMPPVGAGSASGITQMTALYPIFDKYVTAPLKVAGDYIGF
jgi:hypothetical protein